MLGTAPRVIRRNGDGKIFAGMEFGVLKPLLSTLILPPAGPIALAFLGLLLAPRWRSGRVIGVLALASLAVVAVLMPIVSPHASWAKWLITMLSTALVANWLPDFFLSMRTKDRAQKMQDALPDIIDLLVICTESGLGMDAAIAKVARDMARSSPELAEEFYIMGLAIRAGEARMSALRNLALRVNLEDLNDLVSMLIQADRFGTSLAESLRIQSEVMRVKRLQRAEEMAAKIPTKMLLPLIGFIFPVLLMVLLGPAALQMSKVFAN